MDSLDKVSENIHRSRSSIGLNSSNRSHLILRKGRPAAHTLEVRMASVGTELEAAELGLRGLVGGSLDLDISTFFAYAS